MQKVKEKREIFKSFLEIEEGIIEHVGPDGKKHTYSRERLVRDNASCVLIHHIEKGVFVLTKQFRFAISDFVKEPIMEIMAGKFSEGEEPLEAAIRESEEECGYSIKKENIEPIASYYASPGYTTEKYFLYYATVSSEDKVSEGGGLENENEYIEVIELPEKELIKMAKENTLEDSKTLVSALWFIINKC
ncbi:MAG: NUDIX hydrolase [Bacteroidetes bacterium]|nr:NUDIX hydrolase [Bacteroidota bacterium]